MQIVIDIPKEYYEALKEMSDESLSIIDRAIIRYGTPLPEKHGRLKDIDAFITKVKADRKHSAYLKSWTVDDVLNALNNSYAPTIIEGSDSE